MRHTGLLLLILLASCASRGSAFRVPDRQFSLEPAAATDIPNSGRGLYRWQGQQYLCAPTFDSYRRWRWAELEPAPGSYDWAPIRAELAAAAARGQRTWIGLAMATVPGEAALPVDMQQPGWGAWQSGAWYPSYNHLAVRQRLEALLDSFVQEFPNDSRIAGIQLRAYGQFGELYIPWDTPADSPIRASEATARWMIDAWHTRLAGRYRLSIALTDQHSDDPATRNNNRFMFQYALTKAPAWGWFRDAVGHAEQMRSIDAALASTAVIDGVAIGPTLRDRWQIAPVFGEMIGGFLEQDAQAFLRPVQFALALEQVARYHIALLGNGNFVGQYNRAPFFQADGVCVADAQSAWTAQDEADFAAAGQRAGYRYSLETLRIRQMGAQLEVTTQWRNTGVAPAYDPWQVHIQLRRNGRVVWDGGSGLDLRTLLPGNPHTQIDRWPLPSALVAGADYEVFVAVPAFIENVSYVQPMQLASAGWDPATRSHRVGTLSLLPAP